MSEHDEQVAVVDWWAKTHKSKQRLLMSYPSGAIMGGKSKGAKFGAIAKLKKEGWRKGVPDLFLAIPSGGYAGLWVEMKDCGKSISSLSDDQIKYLEELSEAGYKAVWCAGSLQAISTINDYLKLGE